jgi:hypothetical protein
VSTHAPNFGIKYFYSNITSYDHSCAALSIVCPNLTLSNFFPLFSDLISSAFSIKDKLKIVMFGHLMVIIGSSLSFSSIFRATLYFLQLVLYSRSFDILFNVMLHYAQILLPLPTAAPVINLWIDGPC